MENLLSKMAELAPAMNFGGSLPASLERSFAATGRKADARKYMGMALFLSLFAAIAVLPPTLLLADFAFAIAASLFSFALAFFCICNYPILQASRLEEAYAAEMPLILRQAAVYRSIGVPPEKSLELMAESHYLFSSQLRSAVSQIKSGASLGRALAGLSEKFSSRPIKSAVSSLAFAYAHGSGQEMLRSLADNLSSEALSTVRLFSSRSSLLFLVFIALSALLPAFFGIYAVLSVGILKESISDGLIFAAYLFFFPALDSLALLLLFAMRPPALAGRKSRAARPIIDGKISIIGVQIPPLFLLFAALLCALFAGAAFIFSVPMLYLPLSMLFCMLLAPILLQIYLIESNAANIDRMLPGALFEVSYLQQTASAEKWIEKIADGNYGPLSALFAECGRRVAAGASLPSVLSELAERSDSAILSRSCILISHAYRAGGSMHRALSETAQDILSTFSLIREREATLSMQKYTLLFGGGVLVPLILGLVQGTSSSLGAISASSAAPAGVGSAIPLATSAYLLVYSLLSSLAIGYGEGQRGNWAVYFAIMAPLSILLYHLAAGFSLF